MGGWLWLRAPDLDAMRPQVRDFLQQRLDLASLEMGRLSWSWSGWLWVRAGNVRLETRDGSLRYAGGDVAVRLSFAAMVRGRIVPDRIELDGGRIEWMQAAPRRDATGLPLRLPEGGVRLNDVGLRWRIGEWGGELSRLSLNVDGQRVSLETAGLHLVGRRGADGLPDRAQVEIEDWAWLPARARRHVRGAPKASLRLRRQDARRWQVSLAVRAGEEGGGPAGLQVSPHWALPFDQLAGQGDVVLDDAGALSAVVVRQLHWRQGESELEAHGAWRGGMLRLQAASPGLALRHVWAWLAPVEDDPAWRDWLSRMKRGVGRNIEASLALPWSRLWPDAKALDALRWQVRGEVRDAEIALGVGGEFLRGMDAALSIDNSGLKAKIRHVRLPARMGEASGRMRMDWDSLLMRIEGDARADIERVLARLGPPEARRWLWKQSAARGRFSLIWHPEEETPREARASIRPVKAWRVRAGGMDLTLTGGEVDWDAKRGLGVRDMTVVGKRMRGQVSLHVREAGGAWRLVSLDARGRGDFAALAAHFQLPVAGASGRMRARIALDSRWHGVLDLAGAGWKNLLGSAKPAGEPCTVAFSGRKPGGGVKRKAATAPGSAFGIRLDEVRGACPALTLRGTARLDGGGLSVDLKRVETPRFRGGIRITGPIETGAPWEMDIRADFLDRRAIPVGWGELAREDDKPWALRARIQRFVWDDAELSGVLLKLASRKGSVGMLEATQIHSGSLDITDAAAMFVLRGDGVIDLRRLRARMERQTLEVSATLSPRAEGGMAWRGFALLEGDFGQLMMRAGLSERFRGGRAHVLFAGRGVALRNQPWWEGLEGRVRLRVDEGRVLEGGPLTKLLAITSLADLPRLLLGMRKDLSGPGLMFARLQMEAIMHGRRVAIRNLALRSSAFDMAGQGEVRLDARTIDMKMVVRPLQNLDAILSKIPLLRDILGGRAHSLYRKVYWMHGPVEDAAVEEIPPEKAGLAGGGLIETLLGLPGRWFGGLAAPKRNAPGGGGG